MRRSLAPVLALSLLLPAALGAASPATPTGPALWEAWPTARVSPAFATYSQSPSTSVTQPVDPHRVRSRSEARSTAASQ